MIRYPLRARKEREVSRFVTLDRSDLWAKFRPTKVSLYRVSAAVAFGDAGLALEAARPSCDGTFAPSPSDGLLSEAGGPRAYSQQGRLDQGHRALRIAGSCAAQDVRRPASRS